jgi:cytochrome c biogenesis protein CcdA
MPRLARNLALLALVLTALAAVPLPTFAADPVELTVFHSPLCSSCLQFSKEILPEVQAGYGSALTVRTVDISTAEGLAELELAEAAAGAYNNPLPVLVVDGVLLADEDLPALSERLAEELQARLGAPASGTLMAPLVPSPVGARTATPDAICTTDCTTAPAPPIHLAYISKKLCDVCDRTRLMLDVVSREYPGLVVHEFDQTDDAVRLEAMAQYLDLPADRRLIAPSLYVGERALVGEQQVNSVALREILSTFAASGSREFWTDMDTSHAQGSILTRFRSLSVLGVLLAGLVDGINPCAFATILFFVSYLAISHRGRREMLLVGGAFALGVLVTYFAVGLGAMRLLSLVQAVRGVGMVLYGAMALVCLVLGGLSLKDYVLARKGNLADMSLNLPDRLRELIHKRIRAGRGASCGAAIVTGAVISLLELACTGQVYLPTISYVMGLPEMRVSALAYLALYNVAFIVPLLVVLGLAAYGVSTRTLQAQFVRHAAKSKLAMAVLFIALGVLLAVQVVSL